MKTLYIWQRVHQRWKQNWEGPCGYKDVCVIALPLVLSTSSWTIQGFVDRVFLAWYSADTLAASTPASIISFTILSFFLGTGTYVSTFVAQYFGANRLDRIGPSVWQGIHFAIFTQLLFLALAPASSLIFQWIGHEKSLQILEEQYFRILCYGAGLALYSSVVSSFFSGLGKTWQIMLVNVLATLVNIVLDYCMIFGYMHFPQLGIAGAAWATVISQAFSAVVFTWMLFGNKQYREKFSILAGWKFDVGLFRRLLFYGVPSGLQFFLDNLAFMFYIILVGRIGADALSTTTMAFQINTIAFMPMIGFSIATSILVGQSLGQNKPEMASRATWHAFHITFVYMSVIAFLYIVIPDVFIGPFSFYADPDTMARLRPMTITLLKFIAVYSLFDTCNIIFSGTLKGAGDTLFVMYFSLACGWLVLVMPTYILIESGHGNFLLTWVFVTLYVSMVGLCFLHRFLQGKWKHIRVIEPTPQDI